MRSASVVWAVALGAVMGFGSPSWAEDVLSVPGEKVDLQENLDPTDVSIGNKPLTDENTFRTVDDDSEQRAVALESGSEVPHITSTQQVSSERSAPMAPLPPALVAGPIGIAVAGWAAHRFRRRWRV